MAIYRIHSEQGIIAKLPTNEQEFIRGMETWNDNEAEKLTQLAEGTYILGPSWATEYHYHHTLTVLKDGTGIYTATSKTDNPKQTTVRIPEDQIYAIVAGKIKRIGVVRIFDIIFFSRLNMPIAFINE